MKLTKPFLLIPLFLLPGGLWADTGEELPKLLVTNPQAAFEILGPVGAGKKTVEAAREQLQREAKKLSADAVAGVRCESGGMTHEGLNFFRKDAYCKGYAIRFKSTPSTLSPSSLSDPDHSASESGTR